MNPKVADGYPQAFRILEEVGFTLLCQLDEPQVQSVRKRLFELIAGAGVADPFARSCFWDGIVHLKHHCPSKTITALGHETQRVACWLDPGSHIFAGVLPQQPWAHLVKNDIYDLYVLPLPSLEWAFIKTHELEFGPYLLPNELFADYLARYQPNLAVLQVLLKAIEPVVQKGDRVSVSADHEHFMARAFGTLFDITMRVDRVHHRIYAIATQREPGKSESWWNSEGDRYAHRYVDGLTLAKSLGDPLLVAALEDPVDPDDEVEVSTRAKLVATILPSILESVRGKACL